MKASIGLLCSLVGAALAAPTPSGDIDLTILQFALTLEHLEKAFYTAGYAAFGPHMDSATRNTIKRILDDETNHVAFLTTAIGSTGATPVKACTYDFSAATDVASFLKVASVLEGVGVSAYLGAAPLITNKGYLGAAGSILTIEARHAAIIRGDIGELPFPAPYDVPLDLREVYSLAAPFIKSCPQPTGLIAFPSLTLTSHSSYSSGNTVTLQLGAKHAAGGNYLACTIPGAGWGFSAIIGSSSRIPSGAAGQTYCVVIAVPHGGTPAVTDGNTIAGPALIEVPSPPA